MKKTIIAALAFATIASTSAYAGSAGGRINFYGTVSDTSCNIDVDGQGPDANVYLAPVSKSELVNGQAVKITPFTIRISKCAAANNKAFLDVVGGPEAPGGKHYLANLLTPETGGASNVYIAMTDSNGDKVIGVDYGMVTKEFDNDKVAEFKLHAGYITDDKDAATAGKISSYAVYQITYN